MLQTSAGEQDLRTHPTPSSPSFGRIVTFQARAGNCSCISGIHDGQEPKCREGHGWPGAAAIPGDKRPAAIARGGPPSPLTACSVRAYVSDSATFATSRRSKLIGCLGKPALENACQAYAPGIGPESG